MSTPPKRPDNRRKATSHPGQHGSIEYCLGSVLYFCILGPARSPPGPAPPHFHNARLERHSAGELDGLPASTGNRCRTRIVIQTPFTGGSPGGDIQGQYGKANSNDRLCGRMWGSRPVMPSFEREAVLKVLVGEKHNSTLSSKEEVEGNNTVST